MMSEFLTYANCFGAFCGADCGAIVWDDFMLEVWDYFRAETGTI